MQLVFDSKCKKVRDHPLITSHVKRDKGGQRNCNLRGSMYVKTKWKKNCKC